MAAKLEQSSPARQLKPIMSPSLPPKLSMFGAKAGFVIPKNKIPGSMIIRKVEAPTVPKEENPKPLKRNTKWGPDLTSDPAVRKAKALAYQTRVEQITKELASGALVIGGNEGSLFTAKGSSSDGAENPKENEGKIKLLELEKREIIGEILQLNPAYKAPDDYKPLLKETKIPLPTEAHPGQNIIGVLIGPERNTQKRLQEETGAKIRVYGTKKGSGEKAEVRQPDVHEAQAAYEDIYIHVSADSYDKVDAAVALIEMLLTPVSVNSTDTSETAVVSSAVTSSGVNPADMQQGQSTTSQPGLFQYQSHSSHWLSISQTSAPSIPSSGPTPSPLPNNSLQLQPPVGSFSMPPYTGQPPHMNFMPRNTPPFHGFQPSMPNNQQSSQQFQANPSIEPSFGQPAGNAYNTQPLPSSAAQLPVRPLQTPHASGGWPTFSPAMAQSQRPSQGAPSFMPMRPPISVSPVLSAPSQSNMSTSYGTQNPPRANFTPPATLHSRPPGGPQSFPSVSSHGPTLVQVLSSPVGAPPPQTYPPSMQMRPPMSTPPQMRGTLSPFPQAGPTPGNAQVAPSSRPPAGMHGLSFSSSANTGYNQTSIAAFRPPRPATGDFTFRPHVPPSAEHTASAGQMGAQANSPFGLPQASPFRPANHGPISPVQGFQRPPDGSHMSQARMHAPPPHFHGTFRGNPPAHESHNGFRPFPPANPSNRMPFHFLPPQQNPFPNANGQGGNPGGPNPIYDPFAPTSVSGGRKEGGG
ncbi:extensin [Hordeum vulgare subsp. vulgare]|uniref:K Homology domain-containing protein n=1 Tax=Hordeum vulgare subsp. vulgare TaxID=112509 RepID=A0A8I6Z3Q5_HORVV|nr:extensin [Hordeum vulgare subsp. vulgare]